MLNVLAISGPIFSIIFLGFLAVKARLLRTEEARALGAFVINFALPALLFKALAQRPATQLLNATLISHYGAGSLLMFTLITLVMVRRHRPQKAAALAVGTSLSNSAFMGFPIAEQLFGPDAAGMLAVYVFVENLILVPLLLIIAEADSKRGVHWFRLIYDITSRLIRNPLVLAMIAGVIFSTHHIPLSGAPARTINLLSEASAPTALFYIGCSLAGLKLKGLSYDIAIISLSKLILHPTSVFLTFTLFPIHDSESIKAATLNAAMPMATIYPLLGQRYGQEGVTSAILVVTTITSFFTISALLWAFTTGFW
ncbi:MAG: hypothetical protein RLZ25_507 [Pseudomonadota bacterium]